MREYRKGDLVTVFKTQGANYKAIIGQQSTISVTTKEASRLMTDRVWLDGPMQAEGSSMTMRTNLRPTFWYVKRDLKNPISKRVVDYLCKIDPTVLSLSYNNDPAGFVEHNGDGIVWYVDRRGMIDPPSSTIYLTLEEWDAFNYDGLSIDPDKDIYTINNTQSIQTMQKQEVYLTRSVLVQMFHQASCSTLKEIIKGYLGELLTRNDTADIKISQGHLDRLGELGSNDLILVKTYLPKQLFEKPKRPIEIALESVPLGDLGNFAKGPYAAEYSPFIEGAYIKIKQHSSNSNWTFAVWDYVMRFRSQYPGSYPEFKSTFDSEYVYIKFNA